MYGEVTDCVVMKEGEKPRGFGFVTFADPQSIVKVLSQLPEPGHILDNKKVRLRKQP